MLETKIPAFVLSTLIKVLAKILLLSCFFVVYSLLRVELDDVFMRVIDLEVVLLMARMHIQTFS